MYLGVSRDRLHGNLNVCFMNLRINSTTLWKYIVAAEANRETSFLFKLSKVSVACLTKLWKKKPKPTYFTFFFCEVHLKVCIWTSESLKIFEAASDYIRSKDVCFGPESVLWYKWELLSTGGGIRSVFQDQIKINEIALLWIFMI